jgi:hypothetical protein
MIFEFLFGGVEPNPMNQEARISACGCLLCNGHSFISKLNTGGFYAVGACRRAGTEAFLALYHQNYQLVPICYRCDRLWTTCGK